MKSLEGGSASSIITDGSIRVGRSGGIPIPDFKRLLTAREVFHDYGKKGFQGQTIRSGAEVVFVPSRNRIPALVTILDTARPVEDGILARGADGKRVSISRRTRVLSIGGQFHSPIGYPR
jgi:hypothetical protein